ncbi:MAG: acyl-CoA dehydrogenase family protein [Dehalococcoidia bacterium]
MTLANAVPPAQAQRVAPETSNGVARSLLVDVAAGLAALIRAFGDQIEQERRLPAALVEMLVHAGLFRMAVPRSLGGLEVDPVTMARVVEELSAADGSVGWCVSLAYQLGGTAAFLPEQAARQIFGSPDAILAGVARPIGRAVPVEGGYRVSGRWPFASGSSHATWFAGECLIVDGDEPRRDADANPVSYLFFFPETDCTIYDTWTAIGLRGTASNDFSVTDIFVPAERSFAFHAGTPRIDAPMYQEKVFWFLGHGSHALGIARSALATVIEMAVAKHAFSGRGGLQEQVRLQAQVAEAQALIESGRAYLYLVAEAAWQQAAAGQPLSDGQRAQVRLATSTAARNARLAVDLLHGAAGTAAIFAESPLDRQFRDIHTAVAHVMIGAGTYEAAGRVALGLSAGMPFF